MKYQMSFFLLASMVLTACQSPYTITFNERVVYSPNEDLSGGILEDANLQGCLNQILAGNGEGGYESVTLMACPGAGIQSLRGIDALVNLEQLDLSENDIGDLTPLIGLKKLRLLSLRDNDIRSISILVNLPILRFVSLQGNSNIPCRQLDILQEKIGNTLSRPLSCAS